MTKRRGQKSATKRKVFIRKSVVFAALSDANLYAGVIHMLAETAQENPDASFAALIAIEGMARLMCRHADQANVKIFGEPGFGTFSEYFGRLSRNGANAGPGRTHHRQSKKP